MSKDGEEVDQARNQNPQVDSVGEGVVTSIRDKALWVGDGLVVIDANLADAVLRGRA